MASHADYISDPTGIEAVDLKDMIGNAQSGSIKVYVVEMSTGERTPIVAAMLDDESDDAPNVYLYAEPV